MENSSHVSTFATAEARVGIFKVELAEMIPATIADGVGEELPGRWKLKRGETSSGVVTDDDDGDGGGTAVG